MQWQRNARGENKKIKEGRLADVRDEKPDLLQQRDLDAHWIQKSISDCCYKNIIYVDVVQVFIRRYAVIPVNIHDSQMLPLLLDLDNEHDYVWTDSPY